MRHVFLVQVLLVTIMTWSGHGEQAARSGNVPAWKSQLCHVGMTSQPASQGFLGHCVTVIVTCLQILVTSTRVPCVSAMMSMASDPLLADVATWCVVGSRSCFRDQESAGKLPIHFN